MTDQHDKPTMGLSDMEVAIRAILEPRGLIAKYDSLIYYNVLMQRPVISGIKLETARTQVTSHFDGDTTVWQLTAAIMHELNKPVTQVLPLVQAFMLVRADAKARTDFTHVNTENIVQLWADSCKYTTFPTLVQAFFDTTGIARPDKKYVNKDEAAHFRSLKSEINTITFKDMLTDINLLDSMAGYKEYMQVPQDMQDLAYLCLCISGEAGEIANSCKKLLRDGWTESEYDNLQKELVDVLIYIAKLIENTGIDLDLIWKEKISELYGRNHIEPPLKLSFEEEK